MLSSKTCATVAAHFATAAVALRLRRSGEAREDTLIQRGWKRLAGRTPFRVTFSSDVKAYATIQPGPEGTGGRMAHLAGDCSA